MLSLRVYEASFEGGGGIGSEGSAPAAGILPRSFSKKGSRPESGEDVAGGAGATLVLITVVVCVGVTMVWFVGDGVRAFVLLLGNNCGGYRGST